MNTTWTKLGLCSVFIVVNCGGGDAVTIGTPPEADASSPADSSATDSGQNQPLDASINSDATTPQDGGTALDASSVGVSNILGVVLWLDASKNVTITNNRVTTWGDRSTHHNDAKGQAAASLVFKRNPTQSSNAIGGLAGIHFDATGGPTTLQNATSGNILTVPDNADGSLDWSTSDFYVAVVARFDNDPKNGNAYGVANLFSKTTSSGNSAISGVFLSGNIPSQATVTSGLLFLTNSTPSNFITSSTAYNDNTPHLYAAERVSGKLDLQVDGVSVATSTSTGVNVDNKNTSVRIGADGDASTLRMNGDISEIIAEIGVTGSDRTVIEDYLKAKYSL